MTESRHAGRVALRVSAGIALAASLIGAAMFPSQAATATCAANPLIPARLLIILVGVGIVRLLWGMGAKPRSFRYAGPSGEPESNRPHRSTDALVSVFWAMFPWLLFMALVILVFLTATGRC